MHSKGKITAKIVVDDLGETVLNGKVEAIAFGYVDGARTLATAAGTEENVVRSVAAVILALKAKSLLPDLIHALRMLDRQGAGEVVVDKVIPAAKGALN